MATFEWIIVLLLGAATLTALARQVGALYPTFLAIGGALLAFVPTSPSWTLDPQLALTLFVAPVQELDWAELSAGGNRAD